MHTHSVEMWRHRHDFLGEGHARNERRTWTVVGITAAMMVVEIIAGTLFNSMALLADGWHMATHAGALAIAGFAYSYSRRRIDDSRFTFGTGKVGDLAGYTNAVGLALIAIFIGWQSIHRMFAPVVIAFGEAITITVIGLIVNLVCAALLQTHGHGHGPEGTRDIREDHHHDHNLRGAFLHVMADALTSVLAIIALCFGYWFGAAWLDPMMGLIGALMIARWSWGLICDSGMVLLDRMPDRKMATRVQKIVEEDSRDKISDLHLWRVGPGHWAAILSVVTSRQVDCDHYKSKLADLGGLAHVTVEIRKCIGRTCASKTV